MSENFYHGTAAEEHFTGFDGNLVYLSPNQIEARVFAENPILAKGKKGIPRVLLVQAKPGKIKDIDDVITDAIFNDYDIDEIIENEARLARKEGYHYLEFIHPGVENDFIARISLYPKEDLIIKSFD